MGPRTVRLVALASLLLNGFLLLNYSLWSGSTVRSKPSVPAPVTMSYTLDLRHNISSQELADSPLVFVGGVPRSGTTLARAMLDAHPDIRCGEETRVIPRIVSMRSRWDKVGKEHQRLENAGVTDDVLDRATRAFISEIIVGHGKPAKYLCNKDPLVVSYMNDLIRMFPKAKFVVMIRDGRAVAYSIVSRNVTISGVDSKSYLSAGLFWNKVVEKMIRSCSEVGGERCMAVFYEQLVEDPETWMRKILKFLGVRWHDNVLHHESFINSEVSVSKLEPSSNQIVEAVHTKALEKWRTKLSPMVQRQIYEECDMLKELGYRP